MFHKIEKLLGLELVEDAYADLAGWFVVAMLLLALGFGLGVWYAGMLEVRT